MPQFLDQFPEINPVSTGSSFKKGLMTAMIELGAFIGTLLFSWSLPLSHSLTQATGAMNQGWIADKISRKWSIFLASCVFLVGSALQTGSVNYEMLTASRFIGGIGVGM